MTISQVALAEQVVIQFDTFLGCGIPAHGFLCLRCGDCGRDKLLANSCKCRWFCLALWA